MHIANTADESRDKWIRDENKDAVVSEAGSTPRLIELVKLS